MMLAEPEVKQRLGALGFEAKSSTPAEFAKFIDNQMATYSKVIKDANIQTE
jgi:tripartite-type tricarboxylate transporter receptor subunit TctC